ASWRGARATATRAAPSWSTRRSSERWSAGGPPGRDLRARQLRGPPHVRGGGELRQTGGVVVGQAQGRDELAQGGAVDAVPAGQLLELLVRVVHALDAAQERGAHDGLDRLRQHLPVAVQVRVQRIRVALQAAQAL